MPDQNSLLPPRFPETWARRGRSGVLDATVEDRLDVVAVGLVTRACRLSLPSGRPGAGEASRLAGGNREPLHLRDQAFSGVSVQAPRKAL